MNFILGFVAGIVVATVGFTGITLMADHAVDQAKQFVQEQVKK
jgi:hypothetical protein